MINKKFVKIFLSKLINGILFFNYFFFKIFGIKFLIVKIYSERIGHMAVLTDHFFRKEKFNKSKKIFIAISQKNVANEFLIKLIKEKIITLKLPLAIFNFLCWSFKGKVFFKDTAGKDLYSDYETFNLIDKSLSINNDDKLTASKLLSCCGIKEHNWYVCFHNRTSKYLSDYDKHLYGHKVNFSYHDFRDSRVCTYKEALEYIIEKGGYVIRVGHDSGEDLDFIKNKDKVLDFSKEKRSDFMDIYLSSSCKFFLGGNAGISVIPYIFDKPLLLTNYTPIFVSPSPKINSKSIPSLIWCDNKKRYLHFSEIFQSDIWKFGSINQFKEKNLRVIPNINEDILSACKEMFHFLENNNYHRDLQKKTKHIKEKFNEILPIEHPGKNKKEYLNVICNSFYIRYSELIL